MNLNEKIAYIRGLAEGLNLDQSKDEVKVLNAIIELLDDMSYTVTQMEDLYDELSEQIDAVDEDLSYLEDDFYEDYDEDECDDDCDCGCCGNQNKEIAFELCRTLIEGRTYTAEGAAEAFRKIYDTVKSCK